MSETEFPLEGGCDCGAIRCQKRTGSAFVINALVEADRITTSGADLVILTSKVENLNHQHLHQCPVCRVTLFSTFDSEGGYTRFLRVGTLDSPSAIVPDIHIYTSSKQPWVTIPDGVPHVSENYEAADIWTQESLQRAKALEPLKTAYWNTWVIEARRTRLAQQAQDQASD